MPRLPKPKELRQNTEHRDIGLVVDLPRKVPPVPPGLLETTENWWRVLWTSPLGTTVADTSLPALEWLFRMYDRRERADREVREFMLVAGAVSQPVLNPLFKLIKDLSGEIRQYEDRFGFNSQALLKLGIQFGQAQDSLEAINRRLNERSHPAKADEDDPRIIDITANAR